MPHGSGAPALWHQGDFMENNSSVDWGGGWFQDDSGPLHSSSFPAVQPGSSQDQPVTGLRPGLGDPCPMGPGPAGPRGRVQEGPGLLLTGTQDRNGLSTSLWAWHQEGTPRLRQSKTTASSRPCVWKHKSMCFKNRNTPSLAQQLTSPTRSY